jgi:hypothetical protein
MRKMSGVLEGCRRTILVGLVCGGFLGVASVALAATAYSAYGYTGTVNGHDYGTRSIVYTQQPGSPSDWAGTTVYTTGGENVGAGWMAADARKFKNGSLCDETGYLYNSISTNWEEPIAEARACGSGTYYSYGLIAVWNGNGYNYYYSQKSPSLNG